MPIRAGMRGDRIVTGGSGTKATIAKAAMIAGPNVATRRRIIAVSSPKTRSKYLVARE